MNVTKNEAGLATRFGTKTMAETLRKATALAAAGDEVFAGDTGALREVLRASLRSKGGGQVSGRVDEELAKAVLAEVTAD